MAPSPWPRSHGNSHGQSGGVWRHWRVLLGAITLMLLLVGWYAQQPIDEPMRSQPQWPADGGAMQQQLQQHLHQLQQLQALELDRTPADAVADGSDATADVAGASSAGGLSSLSASLRSSGSVRLAPVQLWATRGHCGGARLSRDAELRLRHGYPLQRRTMQLTAGDSYAAESPAPALLRLTADAHGQIRVPYIRAEDAAAAALAAGVALPTDAAAFAALTGALPAGRGASSTFCLTDPAALREERQRVDQHKQAALAGHPNPSDKREQHTRGEGDNISRVPAAPFVSARRAHFALVWGHSCGCSGCFSYLRIDLDCMTRRWRRCLLVLRLDDPDSLAWEAAPQPWRSGARNRKGRGPGRSRGGGGGGGRGRGPGRAARPTLSFSPSAAGAHTDESEDADDGQQIQLTDEPAAAGVDSDSAFDSDSSASSADGAASLAAAAAPPPAASSVIGVVRIHSACRGRGECERWDGPLPK